MILCPVCETVPEPSCACGSLRLLPYSPAWPEAWCFGKRWPCHVYLHADGTLRSELANDICVLDISWEEALMYVKRTIREQADAWESEREKITASVLGS